MTGHDLPVVKKVRPKVVDSTNMIEMVMGEQHRIQLSNPFAQHLLSTIWSSIDQNA